MQVVSLRLQEQGLSRGDLAEQLRVSDSYIALLMTGKRQSGVIIVGGVMNTMPNLSLEASHYCIERWQEWAKRHDAR